MKNAVDNVRRQDRPETAVDGRGTACAARRIDSNLRLKLLKISLLRQTQLNARKENALFRVHAARAGIRGESTGWQSKGFALVLIWSIKFVAWTVSQAILRV